MAAGARFVNTIGIDVGGTFTDLVLYDGEGHQLWRHKTLSTPSDPARGALSGLNELLRLSGSAAGEVAEVTYATTVATNTVLQRKGPRAALITTRGFRDVLLIGRQDRHHLFDLFIQKRAPILRRREIFTVSERMTADGTPHRPLDRDEARALARRLREEGFESVAVCLLHAYVNPAHEQQLLEILAEEHPDCHVSASHAVAPFIREYERVSTTVVDAFVKPPVVEHLAGMDRGMGQAGVVAPFNVMLSDASIRLHSTAAEQPVRLIESGPAAAAQAAAFVGRLAGETELIAFDMGGTTAKVAIIEDGAPALSDELEVDRQEMIPRSGLPLVIPSVDLIEIGSGGGSIARVEMGSLKVGPQSAGAEPGPACYPGGGSRPTVTDADLVLGFLDPAYFLGGDMQLDREAAQSAIREQIAEPLGIDLETAAVGIFEVVNAAMERAIRGGTAQRGRDQRGYALVATGGAGPVHALAIARVLGIPRVIVPGLSGVASAVGMLAAERRVSLARTGVRTVDDGFPAYAGEQLESLGREALAELARASGSHPEVSLRRAVDLRMVGQGFELTVAVDEGTVDVDELLERFHRQYEALYSLSDRSATVEATTWRVDAVTPRRTVSLEGIEAAMDSSDSAPSSRRMYDAVRREFVDARILHYGELQSGTPVAGPAVVQMRDATLVIFSGDVAALDAAGNIVVTVGKDAPMSVLGTGADGAAGENTVGQLDPITFTVVWDGLNGICNEMGYHLMRTAFSELAREAADISAAFYDRRGRLIAQGVFSPGHLGAMISVIEHVVENFPLEEFRPGDAIVTNDIYIGAGQLSDTFTIAPVFAGDELFGFVGSSSHLMDVGGAAPGSQMVTGVYDNYSEGIRIPPLKLFRAGSVQDELLYLITYNTRFPDQVAGDMRAMYNACSVGARRILELVDRYGVETMEACFDEILDRSEAQVRAALAEVPDGAYDAELFLDDYGPDTEPIRMACDVTVQGSEITVDWTRSSDQVPAGINSTRSYTYAYSYFSVKALIFPDVPQNAGCMRPFSLITRPGSFFDPIPPGPGAGRAMTIHRHFETVASALGDAVPESAIGASSQWCTVLVGGRDPDRDRNYLYTDLLLGGFAARSTMDGTEGICTVFNSRNIPIEVTEVKSPVLVEDYGFVPDSGGPGRFRGACAIFKDVGVHGVGNRATPVGDRHVYPPHGVRGGGDGGLATVLQDPGTGKERKLHSKGITWIPQGAVVRFQTSGAGGYGPPQDREPEAVRSDVIDGFVSRDRAESEYGVVLRDDLEVDEEQTRIRRERLRGGVAA